jgi:hypothetical protein
VPRAVTAPHTSIFGGTYAQEKSVFQHCTAAQRLAGRTFRLRNVNESEEFLVFFEAFYASKEITDPYNVQQYLTSLSKDLYT